MKREEWLQWRKEGIGSSDAAIVMGISPYGSPLSLYEEKISQICDEKAPNFAMQRGIELEPIARLRFSTLRAMETDVDDPYDPTLCVMKDHPFMRCSLDGASRDLKEIIEIKYQGKVAHESGIIPPHYMVQMQHQLLISRAERCFFVSFNGETIKIIEVAHDLTLQEQILEKCAEFWDRVQRRDPPPPPEPKKRRSPRKNG